MSYSFLVFKIHFLLMKTSDCCEIDKVSINCDTLFSSALYNQWQYQKNVLFHYEINNDFLDLFVVKFKLVRKFFLRNIFECQINLHLCKQSVKTIGPIFISCCQMFFFFVGDRLHSGNVRLLQFFDSVSNIWPNQHSFLCIFWVIKVTWTQL